MFEVNEGDVIVRLKVIFDNLLKKEYITKDNVYFEKLYQHLSSEEHCTILSEPFISEWLEKCAELLKNDFNQVHPQVVTFCYNLSARVISNQWLIPNSKNFMIKLMSILFGNVSRFTDTNKFAALRLIKQFAQFSMGCELVAQKRTWKMVLNFCMREQTVFLVHEARLVLYEYLFKFLVKSKNIAAAEELITDILKPICDTLNRSVGTETEWLVHVDDNEYWQKLDSSLDMLTVIFKCALESTEKVELLKYFEISGQGICLTMWKLLNFTKKSYYVEKIFNIMTICSYITLLEEEWTGSGQISADKFNKFGTTFFNAIRVLLERRDCSNVLHCVRSFFIYWYKLGDRVPSKVIIHDELVCFPNILLLYIMCPLHFHINSKCISAEKAENYYDEAFLQHVMNIKIQEVYRLAYAFRDICSDEENVVYEIAYKAVNCLLSYIHIFAFEQAVFWFHGLSAILRFFTQVLTEDLINPHYAFSSVTDNEKMCYATLVATESLIRQHQITWRESIESICLVNFVVIILERKMSIRLCVQALKVIQLSIENFMAPNMALLVDDLNGSSLSCLGPIIMKHINDPSWEVRDSTLELIRSITQISRIKFQTFQKLLIDHGVFPIVFKMAKDDPEYYVRATAYKCLAAMVILDIIWEKYAPTNELIEHLLTVLYNESEALVRMEAATTLAKIYEKRKIPSHFEDKLYSIFTYLSLSDLHWEVNICALYFWKLEIYRRCTDQGMIDGTFPSVTFSKEHKKIVQLNPREINLRITKIIYELSARGCLAVLFRCLTEECSLAVKKKAKIVLTPFQMILKKYNYEIDECLVQCLNKGALNAEISLPNEVDKLSNEDDKNADEIIDDILDGNDFDFFLNAHNDDNIISVQNSVDPLFYKKYAHMHTLDILNLLNTKNLDSFVENSEKWLNECESFESLVNEMFFMFDQTSTNSYTADCF